MSKTTIHFAHANSFPAGTYNKLFSLLADEFEIGYIECHAHNPQFPVTDGWAALAHELYDEISRRYDEPVIGVGHSLGGILHFLVACEHPELYKAIILLDSPIISRLSGLGLRILKQTRLIDKYSPSRTARFRRNHWETRDDVFAHFAEKPLFRNFDTDVLRDYAHHATVETANGIRLRFEPKIESKIYRTIPDEFARFRGLLRVPAHYVGGSKSREGRLARLSFMKRHFPIKYHEIQGTHLFPFEKPTETVEMIRKIIAGLK